jgi:hypothetical protein
VPTDAVGRRSFGSMCDLVNVRLRLPRRIIVRSGTQDLKAEEYRRTRGRCLGRRMGRVSRERKGPVCLFTCD